MKPIKMEVDFNPDDLDYWFQLWRDSCSDKDIEHFSAELGDMKHPLKTVTILRLLASLEEPHMKDNEAVMRWGKSGRFLWIIFFSETEGDFVVRSWEMMFDGSARRANELIARFPSLKRSDRYAKGVERTWQRYWIHRFEKENPDLKVGILKKAKPRIRRAMIQAGATVEAEGQANQT